jgi:hypothetical protein
MGVHQVGIGHRGGHGQVGGQDPQGGVGGDQPQIVFGMRGRCGPRFPHAVHADVDIEPP